MLWAESLFNPPCSSSETVTEICKLQAAEKEKEIPSEPTSVVTEETSAAAAAAANLQAPSLDGATQVVDSEILTAQDLLSFEMLDIRDRHTPKVSQTATPNNTPLGRNLQAWRVVTIRSFTVWSSQRKLQLDAETTLCVLQTCHHPSHPSQKKMLWTRH